MDLELLRPDKPSQCTWKPNALHSPHTDRSKLNDRKKVLPDILHAIGQTPMVRLNNIPKSFGIKCEIFAKCEYMNPGGSVKDRIAFRMIQDAEEKGLLKPGCTIIEPTSGNTGIGLAMAAAVKGYKCIIVMPEKMSNEKVYTLRSLGAEIVRTPTEAAWNSPEGHIATSQKLQKDIPDSVILDQYTNTGNPLAHYDQTAVEIWEQCEGKIDYLVAGAGTGGTISGIGRKLKELSPNIKIIAVDPEGSILAEPPELNNSPLQYYDVEGIGYDFIPTVLDRKVIDKWIKTTDGESFHASRKLIRDEGLLCGGSSGSALLAALKIAKNLSQDQRVVIILPDGIRNYMTKFISDAWMESRNFLNLPQLIKGNEWWWDLTVHSISLNELFILPSNSTCKEAVILLKNENFHEIPVGDKENIKGFITAEKLFNSIISGEIKQTDLVEKILKKQFKKINLKTSLGELSLILQKDAYVVVIDEQSNNTVKGILTQIDFLNFISH
ncbi:PREDICTED: cystathionine beta-synthase isoform X2 [Ceratosolen solmsi marchali]|uniref:Cystathionine beta-synthase n=1 Tax=Ceratosolen solmsi marchali TaxID=326594 RepID=A0AAJ6YTK0_9HYME|nr:PREDICTED: cystathionine beta-synthase isoform X2 [Ceratosolen solmsi marchali]